MKIKLSFSIFILLTVACYQSYSQVYRTSWDNTIERQGWSQYHLGLDSSVSWSYTPVAVLSGEVLIHSAPSSSSTSTMDNWFVSPVFNFSSGGSIDSLIFNLSGVGLPTVDDTLGIYLISGSHNPALSNWQLLKQFDSTDYAMNGGTYQNLPAINIPATAGSSYVAFRYKTVNSQFDAVFDALQLTVNFPNSTIDIQESALDLKVYPNPGRGMFNIELDEKMGELTNVTVLDSKGAIIKNQFKSKLIDLFSLAPGVYFLQIKTSRAGDFVKEIIIR